MARFSAAGCHHLSEIERLHQQQPEKLYTAVLPGCFSFSRIDENLLLNSSVLKGCSLYKRNTFSKGFQKLLKINWTHFLHFDGSFENIVMDVVKNFNLRKFCKAIVVDTTKHFAEMQLAVGKPMGGGKSQQLRNALRCKVTENNSEWNLCAKLET